MTADECHQRAGQCAANAELAASEPLALEFLRMAAQWRAMAVRTIFLGSADASGPVLGAAPHQAESILADAAEISAIKSPPVPDL